ncbi:unnamed protein product [Lactuca saligna]|uniref:Uncharacterized protein n=1 Tax=Lactuca saligna TaxID=75948 RepID=A0AA35ZD32_LACSI|nr:unnamed protein product [Lactuca saligna]
MMPIDAPPVSTRVQAGEGVMSVGMGSKAGMGGSGSSKDGSDAKVVGRVMFTQIPTSLPKTSFSIVSTTVTTRPLVKGVVIGESSSSKPPQSTKKEKGKGKGISVEPTIEEKKAALEKEMERQRKIQSILRQRQSDLPGMEKGDPTKHYNYETIEAMVLHAEMRYF